MDTAIKPAVGKEEVMSEKLVRLAAFAHDTQLSAEAAEQLLKMAKDPNVRDHKGRELSTISEAELLARLD